MACLALAGTGEVAAQTITTVAGRGNGDGGAATGAVLNTPSGVAIDGAGNLYVADREHHRIRRISTDGTITTLAGTGSYLHSGDGGLATSAGVASPVSVAVDGAGNVYFATQERVRRVAAGTGVITTVAGGDTAGYSGNGGAATSAMLSQPKGLALDGGGNLYIADYGNHRVRRVDAATGVISTVAGTGLAAYLGDGGLSYNAPLNHPSGLAIDAGGNLYIADYDNFRVRMVTPAAIISTVAGNGTCCFAGDGGAATAASIDPWGIATDSSGNLYITDAASRVRKVTAAGGTIATAAGTASPGFSGDGGAATGATLNHPAAVASDWAGSNLFIADTYNHRIRRVAGGSIQTVAGTGVAEGLAATSAALYLPRGTAFDTAGNLYFADHTSQRVRRIDAGTLAITTVAGNGVPGFAGDGGAATGARLNFPTAVAFDAARGLLYIADYSNRRVRRVNVATGAISTFAGWGISLWSGDGGAATGAGVDPLAVAVAPSGDLYIADYTNHRVRKVNVTTGIITTVAGNGTAGFSGDGGAATLAKLNKPAGVAVDAAGNLYIADYDNFRVRRVGSNGVIATVAGNGTCCFSGDFGPATAAQVDPYGIAVTGDGTLYITDYTSRVRRVGAATGIIATVAGGAAQGFSGDGGPATAATLLAPASVAVSATGDLVVADSYNGRLRRVTADAGAPDTSVVSAPASSGAFGHATFTFSGADPGGGIRFECSLDGAAYATCEPTTTFFGLAPGTHTLAVRAVDAWGNADATPATATWKVERIAISGGNYYQCAINAQGEVACWGDNGSGKLGTGEPIFTTAPVTVGGLANSVTRVGATQNHTCALASDGRVLCWGGNAFGELGNESGTSSSSPVLVAGVPAGSTAIAVGARHNCALTAAGGVLCWGGNAYGQLGNGKFEHHRGTPAAPGGLGSGIAAVGAGAWHACAVKTTGTAYCWGYNGSGQLGNGGTADSATPVAIFGTPTGVASIAGGLEHTCALTTAGSLYCWGGNTYGQLGTGTTANSPYPTLVPNTGKVKAFATGDFYTCAVTEAGALLCWGTNYFNTLGTGDALNATVRLPKAVPGLAGVTGVSAGRTHACAVTAAGTAHCWGFNGYGGVGDGTTTDRATPVAVAGLPAGIVAVSAGNFHSCAVSAAKRAYCWGYYGEGQLGGGAKVGRSTPVTVAGLASGALDVKAGIGHTCAINAAGGVVCWGSNGSYQLGDGTETNASTPVAVQGLSSGVSGLAVGGNHTCAINAAGAAVCWGDNGLGQLGDGTLADRTAPTPVTGLPAGVVALAAGYYHTCALAKAGTVHCWGYVPAGSLGDGTKLFSSTPVTVAALPSDVVGISARLYHTCALTRSGSVWCWGNNLNGQLGDGTFTDRATPVQVNGLQSPTIAISAGLYHTCARSSGGGVQCWGGGNMGQLGDGYFGSYPQPVQVVGLSSGAAVIAAGSESCAASGDGTVLCWGESNYGQAGDGTYVMRAKPVTVLARNGSGSIDTNDWYLDLDPSKAKAIAPELTPRILAPSQRALAGDGVKFDATIKYRTAEHGKAMAQYVFALVPPQFFSIAKRAPGSKTEAQLRAKTGDAFVLAQLTPSGWTDVNGQLIAYSQGTASAAGSATNILDGIPIESLAGARFCVGYGTGAADMLTAESFREVLVIEGAAATVQGQNCVLSGVYVDGPASSLAGTAVTFTAIVVGLEPTGTVQFKDALADLGGAAALAPQSSGSSTAQLQTATLAAGIHSIGASYSGDGKNPAAQTAVPLLHTVQPAATGVTVSLSAPASAILGSPVGFAAVVTGNNPTGTVQFRDGETALGGPVPVVNGAASTIVATLSLGDHAITAAYSGDASNTAGTSAAATVRVFENITTGISLASSAASANAGAPITFTVTVTGNGPTGTVTFNDGTVALGTVPLAGGAATFTTASLAPGQHVITANYSGDANNQPVTSAAVFQAVLATAAPQAATRLSNISTRGQVLTGNDVMIGGFVIGGTSPKKVLITARGPSLAAFGIANPLANPKIELYAGQTKFLENDNWQSDANAGQVQALGTFPNGLAPSSPLEAALMVTLNPGAYTAIVSGADGGSGVGIVEVFEQDKPDVPLVNISTRGQVQTGNNVMIGGFVIQGDASRTVLITARGPSLAAFGITNPLANPKLEIFSGQNLILANDDWQTNANAAEIAALGTFPNGLAPSSPLEAALLVTLQPGAYTAIVSGVGGVTGVGIVEVFAR